MRRVLCHTLIIAAFVFGGEIHFNDGREMQALLDRFDATTAVGRAQLQGYHFSAGVGRQLAVLMPASLRR